MKFLHYPHVDPVEVAMALNPSRLPHWGRFVTYSMWLQGYVPRLTDRVRVYNTVLNRQPRFIPCLYALYGRWLKATLWRNVANVPRRRRRTYSLPIPTLAHQGRWEGCVDLHRSIGMAPKDVTVKNEAEVWQRLYGQVTKTRRRGRLKAGDKVRLSKRVKTFKKGYLPQWTEEVFRIQRVIQGPVLMYKVEEFGGTPVKGTFYAEDLQKVTVDDDMLWRVEKVLKRRRGQMLVRWKGWPAKYDSWIKAS